MDDRFMAKTITIAPVTRLEGNGNLTIKLKDNGKLDSVQFNVLSSRFFEKLAEGRPCEHLPRIATRICSNCSVSHHLTSTLAVEDAWGVKVPRTADLLRRLMMNARQYASHAMHFYFLAAPDFLYGPFAPAEKRNIIAVIKDLPEIGKRALEMQSFGQKICAELGGKAIHPVATIVGGTRKPLSEDKRDEFLKQVEVQLDYMTKTLELGKKLSTDYTDLFKISASPTWYGGIVKKDDERIHDIYDGKLAFMSPDGPKSYFAPQKYLDLIAEHIVPHSYATHLYHKPSGYPAGIYKTGPLAMLNLCEQMQTPQANTALKEFKSTLGSPVHNIFGYHWARLVESVEALELIKTYLEDKDICSTDIKTDVTPKAGEGIGLSESPSGILIYHIRSDEEGICKKLNLILDTNQNMAAIEKSVEEVAKAVLETDLLKKLKLPTPMLK